MPYHSSPAIKPACSAELPRSTCSNDDAAALLHAQAQRLGRGGGLAFQGDTKGGQQVGQWQVVGAMHPGAEFWLPAAPGEGVQAGQDVGSLSDCRPGSVATGGA